MKKTRYKESQITQILKEYETSKKAKDICRERGISDATLYHEDSGEELFWDGQGPVKEA